MIDYYVASDSDKIYAVLEDTDDDVIVMVDKLMRKHFDGYEDKLKPMYVAKTSPKHGDEYCEEDGMRIAKDKLLIKYYDDKIHDILEFANRFQRISDEFTNLAVRCFNTRANYVRDFGKATGKYTDEDF